MSVEKRECVISREGHIGRNHVRVTDAVTGEVMATYWEETKGKPSGRPPGGRDAEFMKVYRTNWLDICQNRRLTFTEAGVLMHLLCYVGWESNFLVHPKTGENLSTSELAEMLKCDRSTLHEAIASLNRKGVLAVVKRGEGRANHILFNSHIAFFGKYIKDSSEHDVFTDVEWKPPVKIKYREPSAK
jgi:DNA-binding MarR family transcriptional regulator